MPYLIPISSPMPIQVYVWASESSNLEFDANTWELFTKQNQTKIQPSCQHVSTIDHNISMNTCLLTHYRRVFPMSVSLAFPRNFQEIWSLPEKSKFKLTKNISLYMVRRYEDRCSCLNLKFFCQESGSSNLHLNCKEDNHTCLRLYWESLESALCWIVPVGLLPLSLLQLLKPEFYTLFVFETSLLSSIC